MKLGWERQIEKWLFQITCECKIAQVDLLSNQNDYSAVRNDNLSPSSKKTKISHRKMRELWLVIPLNPAMSMVHWTKLTESEKNPS